MLLPTIRTEIRFLRGKGLSNRKISWMLGISKSSVANIMREPEPEPEPEPTIDSLGANTIGKRKSSGPRVGSAMGAKPHVRKLLGTALPDGTYPSMTLDAICAATKKSAINIRTILSDLRSDKYCGSGGVFMTVSSKVGDHTYYTYQP